MAEVFLARQRGPAGFEKRLVIKRILPERAQSQGLLRRFFEEARLHAGLSHGNLVAIFDFGRVGNEYFLALELVEGCDLSRLLRALPGRVLPPALCAYIGAELCHALQHVHRQGLIHRDITPRNVLLSRDGEVKLTDFGVALGTISRSGLAGTVGYMAPEQARSESIDARADLFSLGVVLAEAGARGADAVGLADVIAHATRAAPDERFTDAGAMADALEASAAQLGVPRAVAARTLGELVRTHLPPLVTTDMPPPLDGLEPVRATYYRDDTTAASIVDEIIAPIPPGRRRVGRTWPIVAALVALGAGIAALSIPRQRAVQRAAPPPPVSTPTPSPPAVVETPVVVVAKPSSPAPVGMLDVICDPWCLVAVDGTQRGEDGRLHRLRLPTGRHHLLVTRLDDKQVRSVSVTEGSPQTVRFRFDLSASTST